MSFDGDLEHLPIVDVIQLLHTTAKSGTLTLKSLKGESQLVFQDGYIVAANHVNNSVRIGQILLDMGAVGYEDLEGALTEQKRAGATRKPIIAMLVENGLIKTEDAYRGLEILIELTIMEILTWTKGTFSLDVEKCAVSDEYRYFPDKLERSIQLNTQSVLMDALRIYDEKKRDGTLGEGGIFGAALPAATGDDGLLSAADLGLDDLEVLEQKIPTGFVGLEDTAPEAPRTRLAASLAGVDAAERERLLGYLDRREKDGDAAAAGSPVILVSGDPLVREYVAVACGPQLLCATDDTEGIGPLVERALAKGTPPLLLVDPGERRDGDGDSRLVAFLERTLAGHPAVSLELLAAPGDYRLALQGLKAGIRGVQKLNDIDDGKVL